jgi:4-hydroxybenzoate polyprenyltransferase
MGVAWIWLHALYFCVCNQCSSAEEDAINKPYRPVPSGLVSYKEAVGMLFALIPVCIGVSFPSGGSLASAGVILSSLAYTFLKLDNHWLTKNVMNVAIWYPFYLGALTAFGEYTLLSRPGRIPYS